MTVPSIGSTAAASGATTSSAASKGMLGKDDFMKLLVAQMQHQDPMNPSDSSQMAAQLAQFSSLEQLTNISQQMASQAADSATLVNTVNNSSAIGLLGKTVSVLDDTVQVGGSSPTHTASTTVGAGGSFTVRLEDANGFTVATNHMGRVAGGQQNVSLDSLTSGLPAGNYKVVFDVTNGVGSTQTIAHPTSTVAAHVDGIGFGTNGAVVTSGSKKYTIGQVLSVNATN